MALLVEASFDVAETSEADALVQIAACWADAAHRLGRVPVADPAVEILPTRDDSEPGAFVARAIGYAITEPTDA